MKAGESNCSIVSKLINLINSSYLRNTGVGVLSTFTLARHNSSLV